MCRRRVLRKSVCNDGVIHICCVGFALPSKAKEEIGVSENDLLVIKLLTAVAKDATPFVH